jgi:hypothetical protein
VLPTFTEGIQYIVNEIPFHPKGIFVAVGTNGTGLTTVQIKRDPVQSSEYWHQLVLLVRRDFRTASHLMVANPSIRYMATIRRYNSSSTEQVVGRTRYRDTQTSS